MFSLAQKLTESRNMEAQKLFFFGLVRGTLIWFHIPGHMQRKQTQSLEADILEIQGDEAPA